MHSNRYFWTVAYLIAALAGAGAFVPSVFGQAPSPYGLVPNARQIEWYHRERMVFFHFNMNTFTNQEYGNGTASPALFNPTALDCAQWAKTIKSAGFPCAILTAKHQEGFCIWPSAYTSYDVASSAWRNGTGDVVKEFTGAFSAYGLKAGIYLSPTDSHEATYGSPAYNDYYVNQERELLMNYGNIREVWWDGNTSTAQTFDWKRISDTVHTLQPNCIIWGDRSPASYVEARWNGNENGISGDPCWAIIDTNDIRVCNTSAENSGSLAGTTYVPAEADVSIRPGWFYHSSQNDSVKNVSALLNLYYNSVGRNSVLLLGVPPDQRGLIYSTDSLILDSLNCWLYGTFHTNLALGATVTSNHSRSGYAPSNMVDSLESTYYAAPDANTTDTAVFNLGSSMTFDVIMLQEVIQLGHRTTGWSVDYSTDGAAWTAIPAATGKQCIGYKWLIRLTSSVAASYVRLRITVGRACPAIHTFGLFKQTYTRPPDDAVSPEQAGVKTVASANFSVRLCGSTLVLPSAFSGKRVAIELYGPSGRLFLRIQGCGDRVGLAGRVLRNKVCLVKAAAGDLKVMGKIIVSAP